MIHSHRSPCLEGWAAHFCAFTLAVLVLCVSASTAGAEVWWNDQWQYRKKISFDTTATGADIKENLAEITVLLRLHSGNFNFVNAKEDGEDIRFLAADEKTVLKHHIERFDPLDEIALVWVNLPRLSGGGSQDFIWMYYGNKSAIGGQDPKGSYDVNQVAVYHLGEIDGTPKDETAYENQASEFAAGQGLPSVIGNGITLNGAGDNITIPPSPSLNFSEGFTFSAWIRIMDALQEAYLFSMQDGGWVLNIGIDEAKAYFQMTTEKEQVLISEKIVDIPLTTWHHLTVTAEPKGRVSIYVDGLQMYWMDLPVRLQERPQKMIVGSSPKGDHFYLGDIDEIQISNMARSADWIRASYATQGAEAEGTLYTYGVEEVGGGGAGLPVFYLKTVIKNITLDGWMVIGTLAILSVLSWMVFLSKAAFLWMTERENRAFMASFGEGEDALALDSENEEFTNSTLHRIYVAGCESLSQHRKKTGDGNPHLPIEAMKLSAKAMDAFKAALEKGFIEESKRMNAWLVLLTMAITGGPFLGLLGTVWGVMNTFAAMAEAGEANIMAIAPGVASALSTTVVGLLVAIPALFAYNYLTSKIKNITADVTIFIDQFAVKVDQTYGGNP